MEYIKLLRVPQYFRNIQRLGEIARVLAKHGFGDLLQRLNIPSYLHGRFRQIGPSLLKQTPSALTFAQRLRVVFEELGPTFIKFAQLIATRPDVFPPQITSEFKFLQDKVSSFPFEQAERIIVSELGQPISSLFTDFETKPLAAASIAQVHRAKLRSGAEVIVKVQRPGIERTIDTDIDILRGFAALIEENMPETRQFKFTKLIEEFARNLQIECDFRREAANISMFGENFKDDSHLLVPKVYSNFSSKRVLTEQYIQGFRADDIEQIRAANVDTTEVALALNRIVLKSIFEHRYFHADPHPGNILITPAGQIAFVDFGVMGRLDRQRLYHVMRFIMTVFDKDPDGILRILRDTNITPLYFDDLGLRTQLEEILCFYIGRSLGELNLSLLMGDIFEVLHRYNISFPPDLLLVAKALTTLEHIGARLDPGFEPVQTIKPYLLRRYAILMANPKWHANSITEVASSYRLLLKDLPVELRSLLRNLAREDFTLHTAIRNFNEVRQHQNKMVNRSIMSLAGFALLAMGIYCSSLPLTPFNSGLTYILLIIGGLILFSTWRAIIKSGGTH